MLTRKTLSALLILVTAGWIYTVYGIKTTSAAGTLTTQDYIDIEQNYAKYYHTIDAGDPEGWADTFTDDGNFNGTIGGGRDHQIGNDVACLGRAGTSPR